MTDNPRDRIAAVIYDMDAPRRSAHRIAGLLMTSSVGNVVDAL